MVLKKKEKKTTSIIFHYHLSRTKLLRGALPFLFLNKLKSYRRLLHILKLSETQNLLNPRMKYNINHLKLLTQNDDKREFNDLFLNFLKLIFNAFY